MNRTSEAFLSKWPIFSLLDEAFRRSIKLVCVFGGTGNEAIVVTASDEMYSLGANTNGCLGVGDVNGCLQPRKVEPMCSKGECLINTCTFGGGNYGINIVKLRPFFNFSELRTKLFVCVWRCNYCTCWWLCQRTVIIEELFFSPKVMTAF